VDVTQFSSSISDIVCDPLWLADRYDPEQDCVHFRYVDRDQHRAATFLTEEYLGKSTSPVIIRREDALVARPTSAPLHFIFHSAFCCSTLLARALDVQGTVMGLKEPVILNDIVGWRQRGGEPRRLSQVLDNTLTLLAQPFSDGEAVVIKPSNICNGLAEAMMALRPDASALLLYAPLPVFLGSIAKKNMWGRLWVRDLMVKQLKDGFINLGFSDEDYLGLTDLQAAAVGWLSQQALFGRMVTRFGATRILMLNSETMLEAPLNSMRILSDLFRLKLSGEALHDIVSGPAFIRHSKFDNYFNASAREAEQKDAAAIHGEEINMIVQWAEIIAANSKIPMNVDL
jgi:hypothetical protein